MKKSLIAAALLAASLSLNAGAMGTQPLTPPDTYTQTRYPIVLVHGIFGFDSALGVDYFYKVPEELGRSGARVYVAQVSAAESNDKRGEQLLQQVQQILAISGASKVNLIGHSQGSPTVRYVASVRPDLVASVTGIGGVNKGSTIADIVRGNVAPGSISEALAASVATAFASLINLFSGGGSLSQTPVAALESLTTAGSLMFNQRHPQGVPASACGEGAYQVNGVRYFSWSGTSPVTNILDPLDAPIGVLGLAFSEPSDGLVGRCSTHLGQVIRDDYRMNHLDEINHSFGITHLFETSPVALYRQHANRLKNLGL